MALNGGQDELVVIAGAERTAASCSAAQHGSFSILSDLQLHGTNELGFIHSSRADAVLLSRGVCGWAQIDACRRGICTADSLMLASYRVLIAVHDTAAWAGR